MNYLKVSLIVISLLVVSRLVPHPPNFTSLLALSFYLPAVFGRKYIPVLLFGFFITDFIIGMHNLTFFTWGSIFIIGMLSKYFKRNFINRIIGAVGAAFLFYIITNFGVWLAGHNTSGSETLIITYILGIPFFINNIIATVFFSLILETLYKIKIINSFIYNVR